VKRVELLTIDGSVGEGGGQILRTSLALSLLTGRPFRMVNIRAGRKKPGLLRQHLTAVQAAVQVGDAVTDGADIGSTELVFRPEKIKPGDYRFAVGTAGSTSLVLQTVLPALMLGETPSRLTLEGGTHNPFAPPFDFLTHTFLPQLARFGPQVEATLHRPGFYPAGGGRIEMAITPVAALRPVELLERGADLGRRVTVHLAGLSSHFAKRAFAQIEKRMRWTEDCLEVIEHPPECGPGLVLMGATQFSEATTIFTAFGERGTSTERIADVVIDAIRQYLTCTCPVGEYLADQLLIPLALAGQGAFRTTGITPHTQTNMEIIAKFLPVRFEVKALENSGSEVRVVS
jgi:RNA 3'-terminal phosphate cyclase (ATP)